MKIKKVSKKLVVNKKTVANLEHNGMKEAQGGGPCSWGAMSCSTGCETGCKSGYCC